MAGYCDLNIGSQNAENVVKTALKFGYGTVAINTVVEASMFTSSKRKNKVSTEKFPVPVKVVLPDDFVLGAIAKGKELKQYTRVTCVVDSVADYHKLCITGGIQEFDIIAVCPTTAQMLHHACTIADVDIITFNIAERAPVQFKRKSLRSAIKRGIFFELNYAPSVSDRSARKNTIANALELVQLCGGKNIIISSGCTNSLDVRSPLDIVNLATVFGIKANLSKDTITGNCRSVLLHAETRKVHKSVISVEKIHPVRSPSELTTICMKTDKPDNEVVQIETELDDEPTNKHIRLK